MTPTDEQLAAIDLARSAGPGDQIAVRALAGCGKTSTLAMIAEATGAHGMYTAFNKAIVADAGAKMPRNIDSRTMHSLAYGAVGKHYRERLNAKRIPAWQIAKVIGADPLTVPTTLGPKTLSAGYMASLAGRTVDVFARSADPDIGPSHVPMIDGLAATPDDVAALAEAYVPAAVDLARVYWSEVVAPAGRVRFTHDYYLKMWQLSGPRIMRDVILFDECQDADPVMADIIAQQGHAVRVWVGDPHQRIYEWRGTVDMLASPDIDASATLSRSFRFGRRIAAAVNDALHPLGAQIEGAGPDPGRVGPIERPDVVLCRTNAGVLEQAADYLDQGREPGVVGGLDEVARFARGALDLQAGRPTAHPELACFATWGEVVEYADRDAMGADLQQMTRLITKVGADRVEAIAKRCSIDPRHADVTLSTAHRAKGLEWPAVRLGNDFPEPGPGVALNEAEYRLAYVAASRARAQLDPEAVWLWAPSGDRVTAGDGKGRR